MPVPQGGDALQDRHADAGEDEPNEEEIEGAAAEGIRLEDDDVEPLAQAAGRAGAFQRVPVPAFGPPALDSRP